MTRIVLRHTLFALAAVMVISVYAGSPVSAESAGYWDYSFENRGTNFQALGRIKGQKYGPRHEEAREAE